MSYNIVVTDSARRDLSRILDYIVAQLCNRTAAVALLNDIEKCYENLTQYPFMYVLCQNAWLNSLGYHKVVIRHYVMIYKVDESSNTIYILRYFHGQQNYEELL